MSEMQKPVDDKADSAAEKAYAAAAEAVRASATIPEAPAAKVAPAATPPEVVKVAAPTPSKPVTEKAAKPVATASVVAKPAAPAPKLPKARTAKKVVKPALAVKRSPITKPVAPKAPAPKPKNIARPAAVTPAAAPKISTAPQLKEKTMDMSSKFTDGFKTVATDAQEKAKEIYTKGSVFFGEAGEFTKGNVKAVVASGKILASGIKDMSDTLVADTKDAIETMSADVKQVASVKSPTELVKLQGDLMQRNIDKVVAYNSKATEAMLKLTNEMMAPISGRFSLAIEKVRSVA